MPAHCDAVGFLNELVQEVDKPWFRMICDLAVVKGVSAPDQQTLDVLIALYTRQP